VGRFPKSRSPDWIPFTEMTAPVGRLSEVADDYFQRKRTGGKTDIQNLGFYA
jgi:hypothetical protein